MINFFKDIKNSKIEKIIAGGSNGSILLIDIVSNNNKYVLYIYCTWRLSFDNIVLTGSNDNSTSKRTTFVVELKKLEEDTIVKVLANPLGDFSLVFNSDKRLDVFCDITSNGGDDDVRENWTVCNISENQCNSFTNHFQLLKEVYSK